MARILVVDDQPDILLLMRVLLEPAGHETLLAADSERALERLDAESVDLVLLDVFMPVRDGWSVLRAIQAKEKPARVVIVSSRAAPEDLQRAFDLGAVGYLPKPFLPDQLLAAVDAAMAG